MFWLGNKKIIILYALLTKCLFLVLYFSSTMKETYPYRRSVGPALGPNCLQRFHQQTKKIEASKEIIMPFQSFFQHWECRLFFTLFHYVLTASYIWIFVEGLYLHMLIYVSVFNEKVHILWYMLFGWCKYLNVFILKHLSIPK